jgi:hypothetical protein
MIQVAERMYLWRTVDDEGEVLDMPVGRAWIVAGHR